MFVVRLKSSSGARVEGADGLVFPHSLVRLEGDEIGLQPRIELQVQSDKIQRAWYPPKPVSVKLDTGADSTYLHSDWLYSLGILDNSRVKTNPEGANGEAIPSRKKVVTVRIAGFNEPFPLWINYSNMYRQRFFNIGLSAIAPYYRIVLTDKETILFRYAAIPTDEVALPL
jgi:hypothetical protein